MNKTERGAKKKRRAKEAAEDPRLGSAARVASREEIRRVLVETMRGILSGRIEPAEAYAIGRAAQAQLRLLGLMERAERMVQREKTASERARAQGAKGPIAQGAKGPSGGKEWVN